jgi:undecaprenyl-diphosphatase
MTVFQAIILGIVQGLTEFLPVSSSGHLIVFPQLLHWDVSSRTFDIAIHVATLFAIIVALNKDIIELIQGTIKGDEKQRGLFIRIIIATIPAVVIGGIFGNFFDGITSMVVIGISLIVWGIILFLAEQFSRRLGRRIEKTENITMAQAALIGCMQVLAFIPGTSRSGVTISAGLFSGLNRETAAKFSFLLAIPAIAGAGAITGIHVLKDGLDVPVMPLLAGFIAAFICGIFAIRFLLGIMSKWSFAPFAVYRVVFGIILLVIAFSR